MRKQRNRDAFATAQLSQIYANAHRGENQPSIELMNFMPCPGEWRSQTQAKRLGINRKTAIAVLSSLSWLDSNVIAALDEWLPEIEAIARGD